MTSDLRWIKARASGGSGGNCVEVGVTPAGRVAGIRDSKSRERGALAVTESVWRQFLDDVKAGRAGIPSVLALRC
jgi:hypothetical protein